MSIPTHSDILGKFPRYECHKVVRAVQITVDKNETGTTGLLVPVDPLIPAFYTGPGYFERHNPQDGGYFVVYDDGYVSFSPQAPFEAGYTRIDG